MIGDRTQLWRPAQVIENRAIARGSVWLTLEAADDLPAGYEPGHVLGLGLPNPDGGYQRHAYTVSRGEPDRRRFSHLYRVIPHGRMTPRLAELQPGDSLSFHGPFHTPVQDEIRPTAAGIILIATGTGIGPIFGYAEKTLREGEPRLIRLYAGFREQADFCLIRELEALGRDYSNFEWQFTVTSPLPEWQGLTGRVTESIPPLFKPEIVETHHFHLVGNGGMVQLVRQVLFRSGAPRDHVSTETYFNHHIEPSESEIAAVAARFRYSPAQHTIERPG
ncbi:MAG TPA: FAD-dependent oxidoreductase [Terriglobia bacterium]|jgi:NAD(P)H-flavin reductase